MEPKRLALHTYVRTYIHTFIHTYIHTYVHVDVHTHVHQHNIKRSCEKGKGNRYNRTGGGRKTSAQIGFSAWAVVIAMLHSLVFRVTIFDMQSYRT